MGELDKERGFGPSSTDGGRANRQARTSPSSGILPSPLSEEIIYVDPKLIDPNPEQPRKHFKQEELMGLAKSISEDGILQPLVVARVKSQANRFSLIAGERRLRASIISGQKKVPILIKKNVENKALRLALIENIQRADLNVIEEANAYHSLIRDHGLTQEQCAEKVGKERSTISNLLRLLNLPDLVQEDLIQSRMSMGHARALLGLESTDMILEARTLVLKKSLSVRKTEMLCKSLTGKSEGLGNANKNLPDPDIVYIADSLRELLKTKIKIAGSSQRGKIEISYFSTSELERILGLISKKL